MVGATLRLRDDVVHCEMLLHEVSAAAVAMAGLRPVKHHLRLAQRRRRLPIRTLRNIRPRDILNTAHQPKLIPSPLPNQLHRQRRQIDPDPLPIQPLRRDTSRRTSTERVTPYSSSSGPGYAVNAIAPDKMATLRASSPQPTPNPNNPLPNPNNPSSDNNPDHRRTYSHNTTHSQKSPSPTTTVPSPARRERARVRATGRPRGGHHPQHHRSTPSKNTPSFTSFPILRIIVQTPKTPSLQHPQNTTTVPSPARRERARVRARGGAGTDHPSPHTPVSQNISPNNLFVLAHSIYKSPSTSYRWYAIKYISNTCIEILRAYSK